MDNQPTKIRLNKFLAERLGMSRREADEIIEKGKVSVDGKTAVLGARIDKTNKVCYNKKTIPFEAEYSYLAFNKPVGYVCSRRAQGNAPTLYELLPEKYHNLKTVGRLDKDSSGLILLTNDGDFAFKMTHPKFRKRKVYEVELNKPLEPLHQQMISDFGVLLDDGPSKFTVVRDEPLSSLYTVILFEGRNRQIRRTFASLGYKVVKLHRISFGPYEINDLAPGKCDIIKP
ncbi:rRNA pseudouridine synthase [Candidatus Saccharibacteria bacterium]|nr:rRNA pseudouridine synthase [Candidatus Saccharibacteria bacterium]